MDFISILRWTISLRKKRSKVQSIATRVFLSGKIDAPFDHPLIHTVRGVGYALRAS